MGQQVVRGVLVIKAEGGREQKHPAVPTVLEGMQKDVGLA